MWLAVSPCFPEKTLPGVGVGGRLPEGTQLLAGRACLLLLGLGMVGGCRWMGWGRVGLVLVRAGLLMLPGSVVGSGVLGSGVGSGVLLSARPGARGGGEGVGGMCRGVGSRGAQGTQCCWC